MQLWEDVGVATALVLPKNLAAAVTYFGKFPREPIKAVGQFVNVPKALMAPNDQLATLLGAIAGNARDKDVVIVTHGTDTALAIRLGAGPAGLGTDALRDLVYGMDGRISDADMPGRLGFKDAAEWQRLKTLIRNVWALNLGRVDLRACEIGKSPTVMYFLQRLFNCDVCCAPKAFDVFGPIMLEGKDGGPTQDPQSWRRWRDQKENRGASSLGSGATLFAWKAIIGSSTVEVRAMAASWEAARNWVALHLPQGSYQSGTIYYHALTPAKDRLVFAGDGDYRDWLVETPKGTPEPKPNLNAPLRPDQLP